MNKEKVRRVRDAEKKRKNTAEKGPGTEKGLGKGSGRAAGKTKKEPRGATLADYLKQWGEHLLILRGLNQKSVAAYRNYIVEFFTWYERYRREQAAGAVEKAPRGRGRPRSRSLYGCSIDTGQTVDTAGTGWSMGDISRKDIETYLEHLFFEKNNSNATRKLKLICLASWWRWLLYEGYVQADATYGIPSPIVRSKMVQTFNQNEVLRMFRQVDIYSAMGMRDATILIFMAFGGLRVGELCGLCLGDITDDGDYIVVNIHEDIAKRGSHRRVDLWKAPSVIVRQWISIQVAAGGNPSTPLLMSFRPGDQMTGKPLTTAMVDKIVKKYADVAGIRKPRICCHMFRATHASDLRFIRGYDIAAIAARLGHANISTTDRYLPHRGRLKKEYRSLREYWIEFEKTWTTGGGYADDE